MEKYDVVRTTLVIPDAHVSPNQDLTRFKKLGKLIVDRKPDRIVSLGDFLTLESLSAWDLNKQGTMEGRRYQADIESGRNAITLMFSPLFEFQEKLKRNKEKLYKPHKVFVKGNHSNRLDRYLETKPELKSHLSIEKDLQLKELGFDQIVEYKDYVEFDGVLFTHVPMNAAAQPISGKYAIHRAAEMTHKSLVYGHSHCKASVNFFRHGAENITQILNAGAFFEHTDDYIYGGLNSYWRGLLLLKHWAEGRFDVEEISLERLHEMYKE